MENVLTAVDPLERILEGLNEPQREAATFETGPLLIIAGAGTGKTSVITRRIAYLITKQLAAPDEILALTYTEKAAAEMEDRIDRLVPYGYAPVWISTFHAFGDRILRRHALDLGLPLHFEVLDELQQKIFLLENLWRFPLRLFRPVGDPTSFLDELLKLISRAKDEDIAPDEYLAYCNETEFEDPLEREKHFEVARLYHDYQKLLGEKGFVDFGDQVMLTLRLFRKHAAILKQYRSQFKYILVDEFQDTNCAQFLLLQILCSGDRNITVVGDDDQSIYRFRGASLSNILTFSDIYPDCRKIVLTQNYRSGQKILDAAYRLITFNNPDRLEAQHGLDKRLRGRTEPDSILVHRRYATIDAEADEMAREVQRLVGVEGFQYSDIAVLVRKNSIALSYMEAFRYHGVPAHFAAFQRFFRRSEILWLISFLHVVTDPQDSLHLFHLLSSPFYNLPAVDLALLGGQARINRRSLYHVIGNRPRLGLDQELSPEGNNILASFVKDLRMYAEKARTHKTGELLYEFLEASGFLKQLVEQRYDDSEEMARNLARFFSHVRAFSRTARKDDVFSFAEHLTRLHDLGEDSTFAEAEPNENKVRVMTVHKAKGLEFPIVFLPGLIQNQFPASPRSASFDLPDPLIKENAPSHADHRQEERRLFYVAMTRAKDRLYLTSAEDYGTPMKRKLSSFVAEALELSKKEIKMVESDPLSVVRRSAPPKSPLLEINLKPMHPNEMFELSYNQVDAVRTCPLKYKISHVMKVPLRATHHLVVGRALHDAIETLLTMKKENRLIFLNDVVADYERSWISEGFLSREHEEQRKEDGRRMLEKFYDREFADPAIPFLIEEEFQFSHGRVRIRGRWDRVDFDGKRAVIIDYKSSAVDEQEEADKRAGATLQLYIYALAFQQRYGVWPEAMELRFIESGTVGRVEFKQEELSRVLSIIDEAAAAIRRREFPPKPSYQTCRFCQVRQVCSFSAY